MSKSTHYITGPHTRKGAMGYPSQTYYDIVFRETGRAVDERPTQAEAEKALRSIEARHASRGPTIVKGRLAR